MTRHDIRRSGGQLAHDQLIASAARRPDAPAVIAETTHTFGDLDRASDALAAHLQAVGVRRGDRVVILADNSAEVVVALYAALKAGGVFVVVNPTTKPGKLAYILQDCAARAMVVHQRVARFALPALAESPSVTATVWIGGVPDGAAGAAPGAADASGADGADRRSAVAYGDAVARDAVPDDPGTIDADLGALVYTSGSTGSPKGVMLTHRNLVHNAWSISTYLGYREDDVIACLLPLSFDYGLFQVLMAARVGCAVLLERGFAYPRDCLARMAEHGATVLPGVPTIFATLLQLAPFDDLGLDLGRVRMLTNTAATLPPAHIERLGKAFPQARIFSMYGLTECTRVSYLEPERLADKITSVGKAMPNTEAYVVDEQGRRVPPGTVGELVVRGASVMRGYWGKPEETAAVLRPGDIPGELVLHTGDQFVADEEGFLYFVGRGDDVFKSKGEKVSPREVEHVLYELADVAEAAVVGVPDEIDGMAIKAVVAPRPGATLTEAEVRRHCRARLESYLVPKHVEIRASLPKTESGKIRKASLAEAPGGGPDGAPADTTRADALPAEAPDADTAAPADAR
ncbi:MAG TPA: class I adenylate-forming enzyme family protein [Acidimicrobiales bacterium]